MNKLKKGSLDLVNNKLITIIIILFVLFFVVYALISYKIPQMLKDLFPDFLKTKNNKTVNEWLPLITCNRNDGETAIRIDFNSNSASAWKCTCDSLSGAPYGTYSSSGKPWASYDPPCKRYTKIEENSGASKWPIDSSIDWSIHQNSQSASDIGLCVIYYTTRALNDGLILAVKNKNKGDSYVSYSSQKGHKISELMTFKQNSLGYIEATHDIFNNKGDYKTKRSVCSSIARAKYVPAYFYTVFYKEPVDNLNTGNLDDVGYCAGFPSGRNTEVYTIIPDSKRIDCQELAKSDNAAKYSFFITKLGNGSIKIEKKSETSIKYSPDYISKKRGEDVTIESVKGNCTKWETFDLTFLKGVKDPNKGKYDGRELRRRSACIAEIRYLTDNNLLKGDYDVGFKDTVELNDGERICCYANIV